MNVTTSMARRAFRRKERPSRRDRLPLAGWVGLGAGLMFLLDRDLGPRRRALLRDQVVHRLRRAKKFFRKASRDLDHRIHGLFAEIRPRPEEAAIPDDRLVSRVRAKIGHASSHPHAIEVKAQG